MSRICIINRYASTPSTGIGGRHHYLAGKLAAMGHDVTLVTAKWHHLLRKDIYHSALPAEETVDGYRLVRLDGPRYRDAHDKRRIVAWAWFTWQVARLQRRMKDPPDVILYSSPMLLGYLGAEWLARRLKCRLVFEVRDIWPLTLIEIGGFSERHPFIRFMQWIEHRAYSCADRVVSNLEGAVDHMVTRGLDRAKFGWVSNGIALDEIEAPVPLSSDIAAQIPPDGLRIVYTGTLGAANALDTLIDAAAMLRDLSDVHFLLVGQGHARAGLEARCNSLGLTNVSFLGPIPKPQVQSILAACDVCYIGWLKSPLYRWGISANKIPEYLYSGKLILHGYSGAMDPVSKYAAGITVPAEDPEALAIAIRQILAIPQIERRRMGENGHKAALEHYDYGKLAKRLEKVLICN